MQRRRPTRVALVSATATLLACTNVVAQDLGYDGPLVVDLPEPDAAFQSLAEIHEGGLHLFYVATGEAEALPWVFQYRAALQAAGWTIEDLAGGGNPFGSSGGASLTATHADGRILRLNAGHPGVQHLDHAPSVATFVDACVWPRAPLDDACQPLRVIVNEDGPGIDPGGGTDLAAAIPVPSMSEYQSEEAIGGGGRHYYYIAPMGHFAVFSEYMRALHEAGWAISDVATRGDVSGGSGTAVASDGSRHLRVYAGGGGIIAHVDVCVWPNAPEVEHCPQSTND